MKLRASSKFGWLQVVLGAVNGIALVLLLLFFTVVINELHTYLDEPVDNVHWNLTQLELDLVRFTTAVDLALANPDSDLAEVRQRYDLFYSRTHTLTAGSMFGRLGLSDIVAPMIVRVSTFMDSTTPLIDGDDGTLRAALSEIAREGEVLRLELRTMEVGVIDLYAKYSDERRSGLISLLTQAAWASGGMIALLTLLHLIMLKMNRQAQRRAEELQRLSSRLQATVATSLDAVIVADKTGRIVDFNSAAERIFGYTYSEAVGQEMSELIIPPRLAAAHRAGMERLARTGESKIVNAGRLQLQGMRKGGEEFPTELSIASNDGPDGTIYISFLRDISQRIADEATLRSARDEALAAEKAKTNFMAVMSHEMRTPLNGVMASLDLIGQETSDPRQQRFVQIAQASAEILLRHVKDVLDISKVDAGRMTLADEDFDLLQLLGSLVEMIRPSAEAKANKLELLGLANLPLLRGDAFRLGQVVQNLLSNANKFTDHGLISVEVDLAKQVGDEFTVELRVTDTGIGIAPDDLERVFEEFVMLDPSYGREVGGTGLGLAISRRLVGAMGGEIGVESELDEGSCFWLRVPLRRATTAVAPIVPAEVAKPSGSKRQLDLLVVEDNATNRILLEEMLVRLGHRVSLAEDGAEGVKRARSHRYDVILMDVSMPVLDGLTAARMIRKEGRSRESRIIAVTAHTMPEEVAKFHAAGMDEGLTKPVSTGDLIRVLEGARPREVAVADEPSSEGLDAARQAELLSALGPDGFHRALTRFMLDVESIIARLETASGHGANLQMQAAFHEGAGAAAMVGAHHLRTAFLQGETACRAQDREGARQAVAESVSCWKRLQAALPTQEDTLSRA